MTLTPETPVADLKGVGASSVAKLRRLGIASIGDLVRYFPRRYDDLRRVVRPADLANFDAVPTYPITLEAVVAAVDTRRLGGRRSITKAVLTDDDARAEAVWFNAPYVTGQLEVGSSYRFSGRVQRKSGRISLQQPSFESSDAAATHTARLVPIYPETEGLTSKWLRVKIKDLRDVFPLIDESLPEEVRAKYRLLGVSEALDALHFPEEPTQTAQARRRFDFEQLLIRRLVALHARMSWQGIPALRIPYNAAVTKEFVSTLPWPLTESQRRAAHEILTDLDADQPMLRLLQGDVGSGKTAVAALALHQAARSGLQAALMAPTEALAKQHAATLTPWMDSCGVTVRLLVGSGSTADQSAVREAIAAGGPGVYVGTHALIQDATRFKDLALAVVDEQHRFGVQQRGLLRRETAPHLLTMTATPIPRSLAKVLYGDQTVTMLMSRPTDRAGVRTEVVDPASRLRAFEHLRDEVKKGRQGFVVYPVIDQSVSGRRSAVAAFEEHASGVLRDVRVGLLHGRLSTEEKDAVMGEFVAGDLDVLVATTVIEVGIDVPNATVMIIEEAQQFGLAQLHQLRGRVGRGTHVATCFVVSGDGFQGDVERLRILAETDSGFELAERDLDIRGPGDLLGTKQSGFEVSIAALTNQDLLDETNEAAEDLLVRDPELQSMPSVRHILAEQSVVD